MNFHKINNKIKIKKKKMRNVLQKLLRSIVKKLNSPKKLQNLIYFKKNIKNNLGIFLKLSF